MNFNIGDIVSSVGGCFTLGIVENIGMESNMEILTIRWTKHIDKGDINFVQRRSSDIVRLA